MVIWLAMAAATSGNAWLRRPAIGLAVLTIVQLALGAGAWVTKYGFDGRVAVYGSLEQDITRTAHVLCGMLLFVTSVVLTVRIARLQRVSTNGWPDLARSEGPVGDEVRRRPIHGNLTSRLTDVRTPLSGGAR
jgi:heme A synthase